MQDASLLFPGQGSQVSGMGRDVADAMPEAMDLWKKAESVSGLPLREIYWEGDEAAMSDTRTLQPALTVANLTLWLVASKFVKARACAGHSLGEYSALAAAGVLDFESAIRITTERGALMADCDPDRKGAMSAVVKLDQSVVEGLVEEAARETGLPILVANYNTPGQYVVSGDREAVKLVGEKARGLKGRAIPLSVSGAFHSPLMQHAADALTPLLKKVTWMKPRCPFYSEVTTTALTDGESIRDVMLQQMTNPVRWIALMEQQYRDNITSFLEVGPKPTLSKMVGHCLDGIGADKSSYQVAMVKDLESAEALRG